MDETALPQAEISTANQPETSMETAPQTMGDAADSEAPFLTVRYNKEERPLTREAAAEYAQKGMNYDKVTGRLAEASQKLEEYGELEALAKGYAQRRGVSEAEAMKVLKGSLEGDVQTMINAQLDAFRQAYPNEDPKQLHPSVMNDWRHGVPLKEAYLSYKTAEMERQLKAYETNVRNAAASMGGALGTGDVTQRPLSDESIARMSPSELERNHNRIWAYLTGNRQ